MQRSKADYAGAVTAAVQHHVRNFSRLALVPILGFGALGSGCVTKGARSQAKAPTPMADVEQVAPGSECKHGGLRFHYADKGVRAKVVCAQLREAPQPLQPKASTPQPAEVRLIPVWPGDMNLNGANPIAAAFASQVVHVEGHLTYNAAGADTVVMPYLTQVDGDLTIGLPDLDEDADAADQAQIQAVNPGLRNLRGFAALRTIGGALTIAHNADLTALDHLPALESVGAGVAVHHNPLLTSIQGFANVVHVHGIDVHDNPRLASIDGFGKLENLEGSLFLRGNASLTGFAGLAHVQRANEVVIQDNPQLESAKGLEGLKRLEDGLRIINNAKLVELPLLEGLEQISADFTVLGNASLGKDKPVELPALAFVGDALQITNNPQLQGLHLPKLQYAESLVVRGNTQIASIDCGTARILHGIVIGGAHGEPMFEKEGRLTQEKIRALIAQFNRG